MDAFCAAVVNLLGPLRLGADGWSEQAIARADPARLGARRGRSLATPAGSATGSARCAWRSCPGIGMSALCAALAAALSSPLVLFSVFILGPLFAFQATAVYPLCTRGADELGVGHGVVNGIMNLAWSGGLVIGQAGGGALAQAWRRGGYAAAGRDLACALITVACGSRRRSGALGLRVPVPA